METLNITRETVERVTITGPFALRARTVAAVLPGWRIVDLNPIVRGFKLTGRFRLVIERERDVTKPPPAWRKRGAAVD